MTWHFVDTGLCAGEYNMMYDERLARTLAPGTGIVRVYGWNPFAVSLGWNQRNEEIDEQRCRADGFDVVRRPTGGRAILHAEEVTYCVVMPAEGAGVLSTYHEISRGLLAGLHRLGVAASFEKSQPHFPTLYRSASSSVCFTSSARYEVQYRGKKLIGSAQRRFIGDGGKEVVLQHGSLLVGPAHRGIVRYLRVEDERQRESISRELNDRTTDLTAILDMPPAREHVVACLKDGFEEAWDIRFLPSEPAVWMKFKQLA